MTQTNMNLELLIKLLKMTTSSNDSEALLFLRKANEQLTKAGWDWDRLLHGKVTVMADPFAGVPVPPVVRQTQTAPLRPSPPPPPPYQPRSYSPPPPPQPTYKPYRAKRRKASRPSAKGVTLDDLGL